VWDPGSIRQIVRYLGKERRVDSSPVALCAEDQQDLARPIGVTPETAETERDGEADPDFIPPRPPIVASPVLQGEPLSFVEFLNDTYCAIYLFALFGGNRTSATTMIEEFRKATEFHYFGIDNGLLDTGKSTRRRLLKDYAHRAYRGCV
jgi:hypothetical protein